MPDQEAWVKCSCHTHAILAMKLEGEAEIYLSFWSHGFDEDYRPSFWHRFKCAWKTLWTNKCHGGEVILTSEEATKLIDVLTKMR